MEAVRNPRRPTTGLIIAVLCTLYAWGTARPLHLEVPKRTGRLVRSQISVASDLVLLPVSVIDPKGRFVSGLKAEDFHVFEDGRRQEITFFRHEDTPVTVGLLVDHSASMASTLPKVAVAAAIFARSSNPEDEMFVVNFSDRVSREPFGGKPFTSDATQLEGAIRAVTASGQTALYDAIIASLNHLRLGNKPRKALVIVSDGGDDASHHDYRQVSTLARQSQAIIYCIGVIGGSFEQNPAVLRRLAKDTGGIAYFPADVSSVAEISSEVARDLREQYTLGYVPQVKANDGGFRKIEVKVLTPGGRKVRVRARRGYSPTKERNHPKNAERIGCDQEQE